MSLQLTEHGVIRINFRDYLPEENRRLICNFRCSYCNQNAVEQVHFSEKEYDQAGRIWKMLGTVEDRILVRLNFDGELTIDSWALRIVGCVSAVPNVKICEIITNNSLHPRQYLSGMDISKMSFNCSFHPECIPLGKFLTHVEYLREQGCPVVTTMVVTPALVNELPTLAAAFRERAICFKPLLLLGRYPRPLPTLLRLFSSASRPAPLKHFPNAYTRRELRTIRGFYYSEPEFRIQYGEATTGKPCFAGMDMINVYLDGTVRRCFTGGIGSVEELVTGKVRLAETPAPCPDRHCQCPTHMIFLEDFRNRFSLSDQFVDHYLPIEGPR